ncbi:MAG: hypothetical protein FJ320_08070 [SAR202 cluster bacterium]|nr:hypothetical protein [SAR202 cluster bacterium]
MGLYIMVSRTVKLNFTIPEKTASTLKERVRSRKRSAFVAEAIEEKLRSIEQKEFEQEMIEGYIAEREEGAQINAEWEKITLEKWPH